LLNTVAHREPKGTSTMLIKHKHTLLGSAAFAPPDVGAAGRQLIAESDERYLTGPQVRERYSVSEMWLARQYKRREELELHRQHRGDSDSDNADADILGILFPLPHLVINGKRKWKLSVLVDWERRAAAHAARQRAVRRTTAAQSARR
jgi:hypothetical protein